MRRPDEPPSADAGPLSEADFALLSRAGERMRALRRATSLATLNGTSLGVCAGAALLGAPFDAWLGCIALVLGASAWAELRGARMLRALDLRAPRWLAINQLALLGAIAVYCGLHVVSGLRADATQDAARASANGADSVRDAMQSVGIGMDTLDSAYRGAMVFFYGVVFVVGALYQGSCAYYYATRAALLRAHRAETPAWVIEADRRLRA